MKSFEHSNTAQSTQIHPRGLKLHLGGVWAEHSPPPTQSFLTDESCSLISNAFKGSAKSREVRVSTHPRAFVGFVRDQVRLLRSVLSGGNRSSCKFACISRRVVKGENLINSMDRVIKSSQTMVRCHKKLLFFKKLQTEI